MSRKRRGRQNESLPNVVLPEANTLQFSFKHLAIGSQKFPLGDCDVEFWPSLMQSLQGYSHMRVDDFQD